VPILFHAPGTRGSSSGSFFAPVGDRLNVLVRRRAPAGLGIACPLSRTRTNTNPDGTVANVSCCVGPVIGLAAVWCG